MKLAMKLKYKLFFCIFPLALGLLMVFFLFAASGQQKHSKDQLEGFFTARIAGLNELLARQEDSLKNSVVAVAQDSAWRDIPVTVDKDNVINGGLSQILTILMRKASVDLIFFLGADGQVRESNWTGDRLGTEEIKASLNGSILRNTEIKKGNGYISVMGKICQVALAPLTVAGQNGFVGIGLTLPLTGYLRSTPGLDVAQSGRDSKWTGNANPLAGDDGLRLSNIGDETEKTRLSSGYYYVHNLRLDPDQPALRLAVLAPQSFFDDRVDELTTVFFVCMLIALGVAAGLAWYLSRSITEPLTMISKAVQELGSGNAAALPSLLAERTDEVGLVAANFNKFSLSYMDELKQKEKALSKLEKYQAQLLDLNHRLAKKLYENRVMLSLWKEQEKAEDTKDFLSHILEEVLQGLPFHYGCIIIRPLAQIGPEVILARIERAKAGKDEVSVTDILERSDRTLWLSSLSPQLKDFLLKVNQESSNNMRLLQEVLTASIEPDAPVRNLTVVSLRLAQGEQHMGSLHLITEKDRFSLNASDEEFLLSVAAQVSVALDNRSLQFANRVDPLTRLYNRGYMNDRLREEMLRTSRTNRPFTLLLLDIDHFKKVNDTYGHPAGDEVLLGISSLLKRSCRASDALCRYGGEEIALILVDTALSGAKTFAENIRKTIEAESFTIPDGKSVKITASMGLAEFPSQASSMVELIKHADDALYKAKREGRNIWRAFSA